MAVKPRFEPRTPATRVVTAEQYVDGFDVYCDGRYMRVGYRKVAVYNDGSVLVEVPTWRDQP